MNVNQKYIEQYLKEHREDIITMWSELVNLESYWGDGTAVNKCSDWVKEHFEKEGFVCKKIPVGEGHGDVLSGILGSDRKGAPILFGGHMDTVFEEGSVGKFKIEGDKAYGPGVLDMKGGIIIALHTVKILNELGYNERPLKIVFAGDEECLHYGSNAYEVLMEEGKGAAYALNMETGLIGNELCVSRKGRADIKIDVEGVEAHAGNDFLSGKNAIVEMAHKILDITKLTDLEKGSTVSVDVIHGGTMSPAVAGHCRIEIDTRAIKVDEMKKVKEQIQEVCNETFIEGTSTVCHFENEMFPFEKTEAGMKFYQQVHDIALEKGFGEIGYKELGGCSDASALTIAGIPTLCSCGVRGQWNHTAREYALVESMFERINLWSNVIPELV